MDKDAAQGLQSLVARYQAEVDSGKVKKYTEEEVKKGFLLPLFDVLGWNTVERSEVSAEEHIKSSGRVDYGFYLNGWPKFYLEAKSPKANIHDEQWARQAVRYAWNRGVTWAVLTNFDRLLVFNAQDIKSSLANKLLFDISYTEYVAESEKLQLLSKESFATSALDTYAEKIGKKFQRVPISALLYKDLDECRNLLTDALSTWNAKVKSDLLDEGVQKLLDRLIFIRVAEDRGVEPPTLLPLVRAWDSSKDKNKVPLYASMVSTFRKFDATYNSNLFSEHPFEKWEEYSGATQKAITILYGKQGYYEYDFKAMPADVLGAVYENYLGHRLSKSKKGMTLDKDAGKRKEQGIYYTPNFIVDYIVKHALQPVLERCASAEQLLKIKVLDPACGSGSFLIKALEVLTEKYKEFGYAGDELTKLQIITGNLYGVDLDDQAVEITRLNLLINSLDGKKKLPLLSSNIKCGNSLISGTDAELKKYFGANFRDKKPFNWEEEFPTVFAQGGFDVVIGNPPYVFARGQSFSDAEKEYYYQHFHLQQYQINTFLLFIEQGYSVLKQSGTFGYIVPNNWLTINSFARLREFILKNTADVSIINAVDTIFGQASVDTCLLLFQKQQPSFVEVGELKDGQFSFLVKHKPADFFERDFIIKVASSKPSDNSLGKVFEKCLPLGRVSQVKSGLKAYEVGKGDPPQSKAMKEQRVYHSDTPRDKTWLKYLDGVDVGRYNLRWSGEFIKYGANLAAPRDIRIFSVPRILVRQIPSKPPRCLNAVFTEEVVINDMNSNNVLEQDKNISLKYLLGVINSRLLSNWFIRTFDKFQRKIFPQFKVNELASFPIYPATQTQQKTIISLVEKILLLNKKFYGVEKNSNEWEKLKTEIEKTDTKIDQEVYKLYGLTNEEVKVVEG